MKIKTITYSKTVQMKQFEPARLELTVEIDENEDARTAIHNLKMLVHLQLGVIDEETLEVALDESKARYQDF